PTFTHPFFLFHSSSKHPHSPTFPTRRSSDLHREAQQAHGGARRERVQDRGRRRARGSVGEPFAVAPRGDRDEADLHHLAEREQQDRKSTRLNSSHLGISYAVFCLKKKRRRRQ